MQAAEMKYLQKVLKVKRIEKNRDEDIREELKYNSLEIKY